MCLQQQLVERLRRKGIKVTQMLLSDASMIVGWDRF